MATYWEEPPRATSPNRVLWEFRVVSDQWPPLAKCRARSGGAFEHGEDTAPAVKQLKSPGEVQ